MIKHFFHIISKFKLLLPFYLILFHCSLPVDPNKFAPQNLKYDKELYSLYVGDDFKAQASVEYAVDSFDISPQLPPGLSFDKSNGTIIGKSDSALPLTSFNIKAFNKNGSTACILKIEIFPNPLFIVQPKDNIVKINDSVTFTVKATGKGPLKFSWLKNDTIIPGKDSSFLKIPTVSYADSGLYQCKVIDSLGKSALSNKARLQIVDTGVVITADSVPPAITRIKPQKDSASTNSTSYTLKVNCTDSSGVASVTGTMGTQIFSGIRDTGNEWTIQVSGLVVDTFNKITVTAIDKSLKSNIATIDYFIKYDPTAQDNEPPTIYFANPVKDTIIDVDSFTVTAVCKDPSGITSLTGMIDSTPFIMNKSATADSFWTGTVKGLLPGAYDIIKLIATDGSNAKNKDSVSVRIKYDNDITGPVITKITPAKDSVSTNETSYTITISCTDTSGVASVKGTLGTQAFTGIKGTTGNTWTIAVTGLVVNAVNKVLITAIDSSIKANLSTVNYYITSGPTIGDIEPPKLYFVNPAKDTVIGVDSFAITAVCKDASGIATLTGIYGATTFSMSKSATIDSIWTGTVKGLLPGAYDTIKLIATDASSAKNKDTVSVRIKYDNDVAGPVITKIIPAKDSVSTNATSYTITIACTDTSGTATVKGALGSQSFTGTRGTGNTWTITVTGLVVNTYNKITVTAIDSSLRANSSTVDYYINSDPTMLDSLGPTIIQKSGPVSRTIVSDSAIEIIDSISDPSGIDSVYWTLNGKNKKALTALTTTIAGGTFKLTDTLRQFHLDTIDVYAVDKSTARNLGNQRIIIDYNVPPVARDTTVSTVMNTAKSISMKATSVDGDALTWSTLGDAAHGTVTLSGATVTYTPANGWAGPDSFFVKVSDNAWSDTARVYVTTTDNRVAPKNVAIVVNPSSDTVVIGHALSMSVTMNSDVYPAPTYKWYKGTTLIDSAATINIASAALTDAGSYKVTVTNSAGSASSPAVSVVILTAPSDLAYTVFPAYWKGVAITAVTPVVTGIVDTFKILPALPTGMTINQKTGIISGTPTVASEAQSYTVTAKNRAGNTSATFSITVNGPPSGLSYSTPVTYWTGVAITSNTPTVSGIVASYSIDKTLPAGLSFNTASGVISGTPTAASSAATYTVTATNLSGNTTTTLSITVNGPPTIAPTLISPQSDSNGVAKEVSFSWAAVTGATGYSLQVADNPGFSSPNINLTGLTVTDKNVTLSNSKRYYWRVCASNQGGQGPWKADSFITYITWTSLGKSNVSINSIAGGGNNNVYIGTTDGVFRSTNNGSTWTATNNGITTDPPITIDKICANGSNAYILSGGNIYRSIDYGNNWTSMDQFANDIALSGSNFYAVTQSSMTASYDNGVTWVTPTLTGLSGMTEWIAANGNDVFTTIIGYGDGDIGLYRSQDKGNTWSLFGQPNQYFGSMNMIGGVFYAATVSTGIQTTNDNGTTWTVSPSSPTTASCISGSGNKVVTASDAGVYFTSNGGKSWVNTDDLPGTAGKSVFVYNGYIYVGTESNGLFRAPLP